jgi:hypothetical protein
LVAGVRVLSDADQSRFVRDDVRARRRDLTAAHPERRETTADKGLATHDSGCDAGQDDGRTVNGKARIGLALVIAVGIYGERPDAPC